ncbi:FIST N-terminal domain-containing protein [Nautilia lithotrophica]
MFVENYLYDEIKNLNFNNALILVFSSEINKIHEIMNTLTLNSPTSEIVLVTTDGEIFNHFITEKTIISVIKFQRTKFEVYVDYHHDSYLMGQNIAKKFSKKPKLIITFTDAFYTNAEEYLKGIYSVYDDVLVSGGMAGDKGEFKETFIGYNKNIYSKGAVAIGLFNNDLIVENYSSLGWIPVGIEHKITKSKGDVIYEIDNKPAIEFYKKYLGERLSNKLPKIGIEFPLIVNRNNKFIARAILKVINDSALKVGGNVIEGEMVYIGIGFLENILQNHLDKLINQNYELFLVFSCMARKRFLKDNIIKETEPFADVSKVSGFFTYGEFYNNQFLNQTFTLCAISEQLLKKPKKLKNKVNCNKDNYSNYIGLLNILNTIVKEFYEKEKEVKNLEKSLKIKSELINHVEDIEKIATFEIDLKNDSLNNEMAIFEFIKINKKDFLNNITFNEKKMIINFLKELNNENYIEIKSTQGDSYVIFAKKSEDKIYGIIINISEIRKKDEMLIAQSRLAQMGEMINMIAHQWRQPINAISATIIKLQLLMELDQLNNEDLNNSLNFISETIQNVSKTIDEFLNFSKPISKCEEFKIIEVLENIMKIMLAQLQNHNIKVELEIDNYSIKSYKKEIEHIILNLLTNARDQLDKINKINKFIIIRTYQKNEYKIIEVEDNGGGIKAKPLEKVFEPYYTSKENGTGLGLYLSKKIAKEKLNGDLLVENTENGAKFILRFKDLNNNV